LIGGVHSQGTLDPAIPGVFVTKLEKDERPTALLSQLAFTWSEAARHGTITDGEAFAKVVLHAGRLRKAIGKEEGRHLGGTVLIDVVLNDLRRVLIGDGWTQNQRNHGDFALPFNAFHDTGLKKEFRDGGNQIQHAMAGIYIGFFFGIAAQHIVYYLEDGEEDKRLYDATFAIGNTLKYNGGVLSLVSRIRADLLA
jgi:hypothetical protein